MKFLKMVNLFFASVGFFIVSGLLFLIIARVAMPRFQFDCAIQTTMSFLKKSMKADPFVVANDSDTFQKIATHVKLLYKINKKSDGSPFTDRLLNFEISFPNYAMLHGQFNEIFIQKNYAFQSPTDTPFIIDAGSNIGISILFFKMVYPNAKIIGFEPSKKYFKILESNVQKNNLSDVQLVNKALSNKVEEVDFYDLGSTTGTLHPEVQAQGVNVEKISTDLLSTYIDQRVDLLKMDIEGAETEVMMDLVEKNKLTFVDQIIMEYHYTPGKSKLSVMLDMLEKAGFSYAIKNNISTPFSKVTEKQYFLIYAYKAN